jgi:hypothetical protein
MALFLNFKETPMSTSTNQITATVKGNQELVGNIIFRELDNGSVELTLRGHKSNEWHILNSTTIEATVILPELDCFNHAIRYQHCSKDEFTVLFVPTKSFTKLKQEYEISLIN